MIAGPSEIVVVADASASARFVASGPARKPSTTLASAVLVTDREALSRPSGIEPGSPTSRGCRASDRASRSKNGAVPRRGPAPRDGTGQPYRARTPELAVGDPHALLGFVVRERGAVFLGHKPEPLGDYYAGPNHVLPTSGTAYLLAAFGRRPIRQGDQHHRLFEGAPKARGATSTRWRGRRDLDAARACSAHARAVRIRFEREDG